MKNIYYPAIFHPEEAGFSVSVPDLEGCFTQGETMDEAMEMVQDAIGLMLEGLTEYPKASLPSDLSVAGNLIGRHIIGRTTAERLKKRFPFPHG